jgi:hypothetical protein
MLETYGTTTSIFPAFSYVVENESHYIKYKIYNRITGDTDIFSGLNGDLQTETGSGGTALADTVDINTGAGVYDFSVQIYDESFTLLVESVPITYRIGTQFDFTDYMDSITASSTFCDRYDNDLIKWLCQFSFDLVVPKQTTLQKFANLGDIIKEKPPFGYFFAFYDAFNDLSTTTPAVVLVGIDALSDDITTPVKTGLTWILYLFTALWGIYYISTHIKT